MCAVAQESESPVNGTTDRTLPGKREVSVEKLSSIDSAHESQVNTSFSEAQLFCRLIVAVQASFRHCLKLVLKSAHDWLSKRFDLSACIWHSLWYTWPTNSSACRCQAMLYKHNTSKLVQNIEAKVGYSIKQYCQATRWLASVLYSTMQTSICHCVQVRWPTDHLLWKMFSKTQTSFVILVHQAQYLLQDLWVSP